MEKQYKERNISLSKSVLNQQAGQANVVEVKVDDQLFWGQEAQELLSPIKEAALENIPKEVWQLYISKKTRLLRKLAEMLGIN